MIYYVVITGLDTCNPNISGFFSGNPKVTHRAVSLSLPKVESKFNENRQQEESLIAFSDAERAHEYFKQVGSHSVCAGVKSPEAEQGPILLQIETGDIELEAIKQTLFDEEFACHRLPKDILVKVISASYISHDVVKEVERNSGGCVML